MVELISSSEVKIKCEKLKIDYNTHTQKVMQISHYKMFIIFSSGNSTSVFLIFFIKLKGVKKIHFQLLLCNDFVFAPKVNQNITRYEIHSYL